MVKEKRLIYTVPVIRLGDRFVFDFFTVIDIFMVIKVFKSKDESKLKILPEKNFRKFEYFP